MINPELRPIQRAVALALAIWNGHTKRTTRPSASEVIQDAEKFDKYMQDGKQQPPA